MNKPEYGFDAKALLGLEGGYMVARVKSRHEEPVLFPAEPLTEELLGWVVFQRDPEVLEFVRSVADATFNYKEARVVVHLGSKVTKALKTAWERNENGWAHRAKEQAASILRVLGPTYRLK